MVLRVVEALVSTYFPTQYILHICIAFITILILRAFSQGRRTNRERNLHARVILITGGFGPLGLTLVQNLAQRGAHIIALSPDPIDSPKVTILITLLRSTTSNEKIFAEQCDLSSPSSVRSFCTRFLTGQDQRLDAIVFAHEHEHIGVPGFLNTKIQAFEEEKERETGSLATFLMTTLLLPALLVAPPERDIRIVNVVNPFYAAAASVPFLPSFSTSSPSTSSPAEPKPKPKPIFLQEGIRSLRTIIFTRHLQRIIDALPSAAQVPKTQEGLRAVPVVNSKLQKSNIVAVSVSPGIGRVHTVSRILNADWTGTERKTSWLGVFLYLISYPFLHILTKSPTAAIQSILHVLFLPTPFKLLSQTTFVSTSPSNPKSNASASTSNSDGPSKTGQPQGPIDASLFDMPEEVLVPGALYADCAVVVNLKVKLDKQTQVSGEVTSKTGMGVNEETGSGEVIELPDDGEYGGELAGRSVWEAYEASLKEWERENPRPVEEEGGVRDKKEESDGTDMEIRTQIKQKDKDDKDEEDVYL